MIDQRISKIKVRRGTDSQRITNIFEESEVIYSVDKKRIFVGDNVTLGGVPVSNRNYIANGLGIPPIVPTEVLDGDIVFDKSNSRTYITNWNGTEHELLLIGDGNCCILLKNQIDDLYTKIRTMTACLAEPPTPPPPPSKLTWVIQPTNNFVNIGDTVTFTASAVGNGSISYVWRRIDNIPIKTANIYKNSITISDVNIPDIATYYCVASNTVDSITSVNVELDTETNSILAEDGTRIMSELNEFILWNLNAIYSPVITKQPEFITTIVGNTVNFSVEATGTAPLTYQWKINGFNIFGETNSVYKITNASVSKSGITCLVSNLAGEVISNSVDLIVGAPPVITKQPTSQTVNKGLSVSMSVAATGGLPFTFQWSKNQTIISNASSDTLTINSSDLIDAGSYTCTVSNIFGSVVSNAATLTVNNIFDAGDIIISANTANFILKDALIIKGWDQISPVKVNVIVNCGVIVGSSSTTLPAFKVDVFPTNSIINLINNGTITGRGGDGGAQTLNGSDGGTGINILYSININNFRIIGGGGGGGGGRGIRGTGSDAATNGSFEGIGGGGYGRATLGSGGNIGENGSNGAGYSSFGSGGSAGYYIDGISFVTWIAEGDVRGKVK